MKHIHLLCLGLLLVPIAARGEVTLPKIFGDKMVLQRDRALPIWGHAAANETVTVHFADQEKSTHADAAGQWRVTLDAMPASDQPREMTIVGANTIHLANILVGEVWLCSGQSNMEFTMEHSASFIAPRHGPDVIAAELAAANEPMIRLFKVEKIYSLPDVTTRGWNPCDTQSLGPFSAVAYFFGKELHQELKVPIGLIESCWGGTRIEPWTPPEAYVGNLLFAVDATNPNFQIDGVHPGKNYQSMIKPLIPFALRGAIWYQGESNLIIGDDGPRYFNKMKVLVDSWRSLWGEGDFPFYYVEIAPYYYTRRKDPVAHTVEALPRLWQGQTMALALPHTGMAATTDIVEDPANIHPPDKWDVGHRLALWALAKDYGRSKLVYSGPIIRNLVTLGPIAKIHFDYVGGGLISSDGQPLRGFEMAGADGKFFPAEVMGIVDDAVVMSNSNVHEPKYFRYGWTEIPNLNLTNREGLPAIPFRTDNFVDSADLKKSN